MTPEPEAPTSPATATAGETPPPAADAPEPDEGYERHVVVEGSILGEPEDLPRVAGSAHAIDEAELEKHEHDDVHRVLETVPGVYVRGEDGYGLRPNIGLRGANSDRSAKVTLMEDGVLMAPAPYSAPAAYYFPLMTRMVGMEVFKGPASVRYGPNTIGGAINLVTRPIPTHLTGYVDLAGGRFGYAKAHTYWGTTYEGFGVLLEGARVQTSGFKELDGGGDTGFGKNDAMLKLGYATPAGRRTTHAIELRGGVANERSHETYLGLSDADFEATPYRRYAASQLGLMKWWRTQAQVAYVVRQDDRIEVETRLYRHDFDRAWRRLNRFRGGPALIDILNNPDAGQSAVFFAILRGEEDSTTGDQALMIGTNDRRYVSQGGFTALRWRPRWRIVEQDLELGVRVHNDSIEREHTEDPHLMQSGVLISEGSPVITNTENRGSAIAAAFHLYDAVRLWNRLTIAPGIRVEVISTELDDRLADTTSERLYAVPVPGVGVHVQATTWLGVFGGVHRGFSPVAPGQRKEVKPELSVNYEAGLRALWNGLHGEAVGFFSDYSNLTGECTFSGGCSDDMLNNQFNAGAVFVYGAETLLGYRREWDRGFVLSVGGRYTYTGSRFRTEFRSQHPQFGDVEVGDELAYVPEHVGGGELGFGGRIWDVRAGLGYTGPMRDVPGQGDIPSDERVDGFLVLDLAAEVRVVEQLRIYALVNNATANAYAASRRPFGVRPGAPLTFIIGVKALVGSAPR